MAELDATPSAPADNGASFRLSYLNTLKDLLDTLQSYMSLTYTDLGLTPPGRRDKPTFLTNRDSPYTYGPHRPIFIKDAGSRPSSYICLVGLSTCTCTSSPGDLYDTLAAEAASLTLAKSSLPEAKSHALQHLTHIQEALHTSNHRGPEGGGLLGIQYPNTAPPAPFVNLPGLEMHLHPVHDSQIRDMYKGMRKSRCRRQGLDVLLALLRKRYWAALETVNHSTAVLTGATEGKYGEEERSKVWDLGPMCEWNDDMTPDEVAVFWVWREMGM